MSPAVNIALEEVPFAILELVKARILANRRRLLQGQQGKPRPSTRPGAQFRKVGASTKEWRKPQYGAGVFGRENVAVVLWEETQSYNDDGQLASRTVTVRNAAGTDSVTFTYDLPTYPVPEDAWFTNANGFSNVTDGVMTQTFSCSQGTPPASFPLSTRRVESFQVDMDERKTVFSLPLSDDSAIFVYRSRGAASYWHTQMQRVVTFSIPAWRAAQRGEYCSTASPEPGTSLDGFYFTAEMSHSTTLNTDYSDSIDQWSVTRCFLVTPAGVTEITPPSGLVSVLQQYEPTGYVLAPDTVGSYLPSGTRSVVEPPADNPVGWGVGAVDRFDYYYYYFQLFPSVEAREHPASSFSWGTAPDTATYALDNTFNYVTYFSQPIMVDRVTPVNAPAASYQDLSGQLPLLTHYGIGALATDWHSSMGAATFYSPAVFTFLNEITPAILDDYDGDINAYQDAKYADNIQYAYIKSTYLSSAPTPNKFLAPCVLSGSCPYDPATNTDSIGFDRTSIQPSNIETAMAPSDFSASGIRAPVVDRGVDEQIIYAYDWNQPAYCRQQLLALGFTAADLTP